MADGGTTALQKLIDRLKAGDKLARWELVDNAESRLRGLAATILNSPQFDRVKRVGLCTTTEILGTTKLRMANALTEVELNDVAHFFRLAALRIRWVLKDMLKRLPDASGCKPSFCEL